MCERITDDEHSSRSFYFRSNKTSQCTKHVILFFAKTIWWVALALLKSSIVVARPHAAHEFHTFIFIVGVNERVVESKMKEKNICGQIVCTQLCEQMHRIFSLWRNAFGRERNGCVSFGIRHAAPQPHCVHGHLQYFCVFFFCGTTFFVAFPGFLYFGWAAAVVIPCAAPIEIQILTIYRSALH